jgi:hypothetical protein
MRNTSELSVVFVGCGGTFFMGMPYFRVLVREIVGRTGEGARDRPRLYFVDPDKVIGRNQNRQWPHRSDRGGFKCDIAESEFGWTGAIALAEPFTSFSSEICSISRDVLLVVNVDNDAARLEVREWAKNRKGWTGMVVSGCEADYGQAYWGAWQNGVAIHDWRPLHTDVGQDGGTEHRCAPQTAEANALTGVLAGLVLRDLLEVYRTEASSLERPRMVREYYWERCSVLQVVKSWTLEVLRQGEGGMGNE